MLSSIFQSNLLFLKKTTPAAHLLVFLSNLFSRSHSSAAAIAANPDSAAISFLINSCGLSPESALSASKIVQLKSIHDSPAVLQLFRDYGLTGAQIATIVAKQPSLLLCRAEEILKPKLEFLHEFGFSSAALGRLLTVFPLLLQRSLAEHIVPYFGFFNTILPNNKDVVDVLLAAPRILHSNPTKYILPSIQVLRRHGLPEARVSKLMVLHPGVLLCGPARVKELVEVVSQFGVRPADPMFIHAYATIAGMRWSTWERKLALFRSFGLSDDEILSGFRKLPPYMKLSEEKIRQGMEFYVNRLKLNPAGVVAEPKLLLPSLEKTIKPRCAILSILISKGKIRRDRSLNSTLLLANRIFLRKFVEKYQHDVPEVVKAYHGEIEFKGLDMD